MNAEQNQQKNLVDTTDCLEAVGVFRCWKNFFFLVTLVAMLLLALCFWTIELGLVAEESDTPQAEQVTEETAAAAQTETAAETVDEAEQEIKQAAEKVTTGVNESAEAVTEEKGEKTAPFSPILKRVHIMWTIRATDFVIIAAAVLYCLTILFTLKISMVGRLGGINHISRAFFWSLILLVLILPWQVALGWGLFGVTFEPSELVRRIADYESSSVFRQGLYWLRYVGLWLIAILCLLLAQIRTARWSKATLKRLEVV